VHFAGSEADIVVSEVGKVEADTVEVVEVGAAVSDLNLVGKQKGSSVVASVDGMEHYFQDFLRNCSLSQDGDDVLS